MFLNKKTATAFHILALCCLVSASDKKIELDDIEQDNLKSERANEDNSNNLETPNVNEEQSAESDVYNKKQYAVEEPNPSAQSLLLYPSRAYHQAGIQYVEVNRGQEQTRQAENYDLNHQETSSTQNGEQQQSYRYVPRLAMHLVYIPQIAASPENGIVMYSNQYQQKIPGIVYQPHPQQYVQIQQHQTNNIEAEEDPQQQAEEVNSQHAGYLPPAAEDSAAQAQPQPEQYVIQPQYREQQVQYVENEGKSQHYQAYAPPQQQYVLANPVPQQQVYYKTEYRYAAPSSPYKSAAPQYESGHNRVTQIAPPAIAFSIPTTGDTPKVLSQYAHGVSRPVYSHISGHLVQDQYKLHDGRGSLDLEQYKIPQQVTGNYIQEQYRPIYNTHYVRKPTSLLDSYIPSSLQIEYLKRGLSKEPLATYDLIANSRRYRYERGFLPNQMYTTPNGGVMFGKFK